MQRNEVGLGQKLGEAARADSHAVDPGPLDPGIVDQDRHPEGERPPGHPRPHLPETHQSQPSAREIPTEEPGPLEGGPAEVARGCGEPQRRGMPLASMSTQGQRQVGDGLRILPGSRDDGDTQPAGGGYVQRLPGRLGHSLLARASVRRRARRR